MRTRVKICGITNYEDARAAVAYGADALGVIAVPESPRYVPPGEVDDISRAAGPFVPLVTVAKTVADARDYQGSVVQYYEGKPGNAWPVIRVFRVKDGPSLVPLVEFRDPVHAVLLDTYHETQLGGAGKTFDWSLAVAAKGIFPNLPLILAGGLTPDNVEEAIVKVRPYAVDVSSGVEAEPGRKDHTKLKAFFDAVRRADSRV